MSVIFQLFGAEDLKKLDPHQLEGLGKAVGEALDNNTTVLEQVKPRASEVFEQLKAIPPTTTGVMAAPQSPGPPRGMLFQLFNISDLEKLSRKQIQILEWAIRCELAHNPDALLAMRDIIYPLFRDYTGGVDPIGSDAFYQPVP